MFRSFLFLYIYKHNHAFAVSIPTSANLYLKYNLESYFCCKLFAVGCSVLTEKTTIMKEDPDNKAGHVTPYNYDTEKKEQVARMFDNIAAKYDFLNHFLSLGIDILWRKKAVKLLKAGNPKVILDVATGTGDFAIESLSLNPDRVVGIDISNQMLEVGKNKMKKKGVSNTVEMIYGDCENLPFENQTFDAVTVAFGVRNFQNPVKGLAEMNRVMKPGGKTVIIEFSQPQAFPVKQIYNFYFEHLLPGVGKLFSKDNRAYTYLPESVQAFPHGEEFLQLMKKAGYKNTKATQLTFGIASIYEGSK